MVVYVLKLVILCIKVLRNITFFHIELAITLIYILTPVITIMISCSHL